MEARQARLAGQELLHGGLFEVPLLGDEPFQPVQQRIHIVQRRRDGALFANRRKCHNKAGHLRSIDFGYPAANRNRFRVIRETTIQQDRQYEAAGYIARWLQWVHVCAAKAIKIYEHRLA